MIAIRPRAVMLSVFYLKDGYLCARSNESKAEWYRFELYVFLIRIVVEQVTMIYKLLF